MMEYRAFKEIPSSLLFYDGWHLCLLFTHNYLFCCTT